MISRLVYVALFVAASMVTTGALTAEKSQEFPAELFDLDIALVEFKHPVYGNPDAGKVVDRLKFRDLSKHMTHAIQDDYIDQCIEDWCVGQSCPAVRDDLYSQDMSSSIYPLSLTVDDHDPTNDNRLRQLCAAKVTGNRIPTFYRISADTGEVKAYQAEEAFQPFLEDIG